MMKGYCLGATILILLSTGLIIPGAVAECGIYADGEQTISGGTDGISNAIFDMIKFHNIQNYPDIDWISFDPVDPPQLLWHCGPGGFCKVSQYGFRLKYGAQVVGEGIATIINYGQPGSDYFIWCFSNWDTGGLTGDKSLIFEYSAGTYSYGRSSGGMNYGTPCSGSGVPAVDYPMICYDTTNDLVYNGLVRWSFLSGTGPETDPPVNISVNILEKYSNAALINQAITLTKTAGGAGETKTSLYGETLHFGVVPGMEYWFNTSRAGYQDYNETYTIPASPGIYNVYMERTLPPIANHSYAHFSVVDQTNGGLIPNAEIRLSDGQTKLTNSAGYTWFSVNNSEQINYYVSKPSGYWPAYGAMNLTADESILVALQRYTGPTATATMPGWTPVTVPTTGTGVDPVVTLSAQLRQQNVQEGMDVWYTNLPFISQFLFLLFIIGGLGLMAGGTRRN
jgi:hypothetical protein